MVLFASDESVLFSLKLHFFSFFNFSIKYYLMQSDHNSCCCLRNANFNKLTRLCSLEDWHLDSISYDKVKIGTTQIYMLLALG